MLKKNTMPTRGNNVFSPPESCQGLCPRRGSANLAQLVEHFIRNERVVGSIPIVGSEHTTMPMKLSQLAETLIGSEIVKLGGEIREKIRRGEKIYNFTVGDFDPAIFPTVKL